MDAIIFDIDGTLANTSHRVHHVKNGNKNWDAFFGKMGEDTPVLGVTWLAEELAHGVRVGGVTAHLFLVSGRPDSYRAVTVAWLHENVPMLFDMSEALLMREAGDHRSDVEVKREILKGIQGQGYDVRLAIDDRPSIIKMWQDEGIPVLQVPNPDWDETPGYKPGKLIMMVGPSGAGKSTTLSQFTNNLNSVVSTDQLREALTGDLKNQEVNAQVFAAAHALIKTRIEYGLNTVYDATNLRNRDRRAILDLLPAGTEVVYLVVDRPLAEKHRDAGWRANVTVKGKKLVDYHHEVFHNNLKDILAGDNDPRVKVADLRAESMRVA